MRVLMAGSSGLIGAALVRSMRASGHAVGRMVRGSMTDASGVLWDPASGRVPVAALEGFDVAVCLSGAGIAEGAWSPARKEVLRESRVAPVGLLARALASCGEPPKCLVCASATGYYGAERGAEVLTEESPAGEDFLAELCTRWEEAANPAREAGIRVVHLRFGIVLSAGGGALKRMLLPFRLGLGGRLGHGRQYMSWLTIDDAVGVVEHAIGTPAIEGAVNAVAPHPVSNLEFTRALGRALWRPTFARVPAFALRAALGEMSGLLLGSSRVYPRRLEASGYRFRHPEIGEALRAVLGESGAADRMDEGK